MWSKTVLKFVGNERTGARKLKAYFFGWYCTLGGRLTRAVWANLHSYQLDVPSKPWDWSLQLHGNIGFCGESVYIMLFVFFLLAPPVSPSFNWILCAMNDNQVPGDPPLLPHGSLQPIPGGLSFDGTETSLIGKLPSSACIVDPDTCLSGFALSAKLRFDELSLTSNAPQYVMDTGASNNGKGVSVYVQLNSLYFKVATSNAVYQASFVQVWMFLCQSFHKSWQTGHFTISRYPAWRHYGRVLQGLPLPRSPLVQSLLWPLAGVVRV